MTDFTDVKQSVSAALESGRANEGLDELVTWAAAGTRPPGRTDEIWVHRTLGLGYLERGELGLALEQLGRAYELEPRDPEIGLAYGRLLFEQGHGAEALKALKSVLIHHKTTLQGAVLGGVYDTLGRLYLAQGQLKEARAAFDDALRAAPHHRAAMDGMLDTIGQLPEEEALRARRMLMSRLTEPTDQAYVWLQLARAAAEAGNATEARRRCDQALALVPGSVEALRQKAEVSVALGDAEAAAAALWAVHQSAPHESSDERKAELTRIDELLVEAKANKDRRLEVLEALLDEEPTALAHFEAATHLCAQAEDWAELSRVYKRMIRRVRDLDPPPDERLLSMLWANLGELYVSHLGQPTEGIRALAVAGGLRPKDTSVRRRLLELAHGHKAVYEEAYRAATELLELQPESELARRQRAQLAVLTARYDAALVTLRVLKADNQWTEAYDNVYARLQRPKLKLPERPLSEHRRRRHVRPSAQSHVLDSLMAIAGVVFARLFAHDLTFHGLSDKDRLDPTGPLMFNQIFTEIAKALHLDALPALYIKSGFSGMGNAGLDRPSLIVGNDLMAGRDPREIAFVVGQQLCLHRPEYVLTTTHEPAALKLIVLVLTKHIEASVPVPDTKTTQTLRRELEKRLSPELEKHLNETVKNLVSQNLDVNVDAWVESVADEAMFTGLLLCEDFEIADEHVLRDCGVRGVTCDEARRKRLRVWAMSEHHLSARRGMGLALKSAE